MADTWSDGGQDVFCLAAIVLDHGLCPPGSDPGGGSPPACVDGGNTLPHRVIEQDGDTVPGEDGQTHPWTVGDQTVRLKDAGLGGVGQNIRPGDMADHVAVNLMVFNQSLFICAHGRAKPGKILPDVGRIITPVGAQVQAVPGRRGDTPQPCGKPVGRTGPIRMIAAVKNDATDLLSDDFHGMSPLFCLRSRSRRGGNTESCYPILSDKG